MKKCTRNDVGNRIIRVSAESNAPLTVFVSLSFEERLSKALPCLAQVPARAGGAGGRGNSGPGLGSALGVPVFPLCSPSCWALIKVSCPGFTVGLGAGHSQACQGCGTGFLALRSQNRGSERLPAQVTSDSRQRAGSQNLLFIRWLGWTPFPCSTPRGYLKVIKRGLGQDS